MELALLHPYGALVMIWTSAGDDHVESAATLRQALVTDGSPIGGVATFRPIDLPAPLPKLPGVAVGKDSVDQERVLAHCCFIDADPGGSAGWRPILDRIES